jgi:hypothetical protein
MLHQRICSPASLATLLFAIAFGVACADSTSPSRSDLNGDWSTGHTIGGFDLGFTLRWTTRTVTGTGSYVAIPPNTPCTLGLSGSGSVALAADVSRSNVLTGALTFDNRVRAPITGVVFDSGGINSRLDLSFTSPDGSACSLSLQHAALP